MVESKETYVSAEMPDITIMALGVPGRVGIGVWCGEEVIEPK